MKLKILKKILKYFDLFDMVNAIDLMRLNAKYQKFRPDLTLKSNTTKKW
jgi:hypothetical protein